IFASCARALLSKRTPITAASSSRLPGPYLIPKCPHADLFNARGRAWLAAQPLPDDERAAIDRHVRELDRLAEDLALLDREIAQDAIDDPAVNRLMTITGVNLAVTGELAARSV